MATRRSDEPFNGWTNWDTWSAHLWLANGEPAYRAAREVAQRPRPLVKDMKQVYRDYVPWTDGRRQGDGADLSRVDWDSVIAAFRE